MQVEGQRVGSLLPMPATGARVRNAYATCPVLEDNPAKVGLILHSLFKSHDIDSKDLSIQDRHAFH